MKSRGMKSPCMKSYLSLIPISARNRRKQNRLTLICIILAVFLVTSIFSMVEIIAKGQEESTIRKHGNYHIIVTGISEEEADEIAGREDVAAAAWYRAVGEDSEKWRCTVNDQRVIVYGVEQPYLDAIRNFEQEGRYPVNGSEVMLSMDAKETFGIQEGNSITIHTPAGDHGYSVSGFCADDTEYNEDIGGFCVYMNMDEVTRICAENQEEGELGYYIQFAEKTKLKNAVDDLKVQYGLSDGNIEENLMLLGLEGVSNNQKVNSLYPTAMAVFAMILIAGMLMISSCMNSNVAQRTKFFGMMRCIGASKQQIMRFVRLEALNWCKVSIPAGLVLGIAVTWIICTFLQNVVGGEFTDYPFRFSVFGIVGGVLVGVVTVLLAAHTPARRAAQVSPVAAVSGNDETGKSVSHAANTHMFKVESALGVYHAVSTKKNLILISLSFAFTVILFLIFSACLDIMKRLIPSESDYNPDISIVSISNTNSIDRSLVDGINKLPGVDVAFGNMMRYDVAAEINGNAGSIDLVSYDEHMFDWSKKSVVSGDLSKVREGSDYVMTIFAMNSSLNTGDKIKIGDVELEVAGVVSEGIGSSEKRPTVVCTEETFTRITGEEDYLLLNAQFTKDITEETVNEIKRLAGENDFEDRREEDSIVYSSFWVFRTAIYGFLAIISLITAINIMNSISMSVSARMKQYGAMRAVGMSMHQMTKMITAEAVTYAVCGLLIGCAGGLFFHRLIFVKIIVTHFGGSWKIPFGPILIVTAIFALACAAAVYAPAKRIREMAITDTINQL